MLMASTFTSTLLAFQAGYAGSIPVARSPCRLRRIEDNSQPTSPPSPVELDELAAPRPAEMEVVKLRLASQHEHRN
jgi:hypothetical protein